MSTDSNAIFGKDPNPAAPETASFRANLTTHGTELPVDWTHVRAALTSVLLGGLAYLLWAVERGPTGFAVFLLIFAITIRHWIANHREKERRSLCFLPWVLLASMVIVWIRLIWQANATVCIGSVILMSLYAASMQRDALGPFRVVADLVLHAGIGLGRWLSLPWGRVCQTVTGAPWPFISVGVPAMVGIVFLLPLVQSDPELASRTYRLLADSIDHFQNWLLQWNLIATISVLLVCIWSLGLLLPFRWLERPPLLVTPSESVCASHWFIAAQNSLIAVSAIFIWFLIHEFQSMWFRTFPEGFRYSAYAHEGAAWLTLVLAMSTLFLSIVFQPCMQRHPQVRRLYWLSFIWSLCNAVLVVAVVHRLNIYINYNGLTRMRIVAFVGVACVVTGFLLVQFKLVYGKSFVWLCNNQLWAFYTGLYLLAVLPMDAISNGWNTSCLRQGDLRASVQVSHQPISDEGLLRLLPLLNHDEPIVRDGIRAMLAERQLKMPTSVKKDTSPNANGLPQYAQYVQDWTHYQGSRRSLETHLERYRGMLEVWSSDSAKRAEAISRFFAWSHQWY